MKKLYCFMAVAFLLTGSLAYAQGARDNSGRPCFDVNVQIDENNKSNVDQNCQFNDSRTMQAGKNNVNSAKQKGEVNNSSTHQYGYDAAPRAPRR